MPPAPVPATTPVGQVVGVDRRVLALDERGMPTLLLPLASSETPDVAALDPVTPLSSLVVRLPDSAVVDLPPGSGAEPVLRAMATSSAGVVVVIPTTAGQSGHCAQCQHADREAMLRHGSSPVCALRRM